MILEILAGFDRINPEESVAFGGKIMEALSPYEAIVDRVDPIGQLCGREGQKGKSRYVQHGGERARNRVVGD